MKRKLKIFIYKYINYEVINAVIAAITILTVCIKSNMNKNQQIQIIDWTIFSSIVFALLMTAISKLIHNILMNRLEDTIKLTNDYDELTRMYKNQMVSYDNSSASKKNLRKVEERCKAKIYIPMVCEHKLQQCVIDIQDSNDRYELPNIIREHFDELFQIHSTSKVYNKLNVRVDDWTLNNKKFVMKTSRTTFFDSLVTNRAMDYRWNNGLTVREQYEFGPILHTLKDSHLSNHLGFNGFVISSDGYIFFVKRGNKLSIGKRTYCNSVSASLNTSYALNESGHFTEDGLINSIISEIDNELKIPREGLEKFCFREHIIAAYRDIVEGGKPQLLFYVHSKWKKEEIISNFKIQTKREDKKKDTECREDGRKFLWIHKSKLDQICILPEKIVHEGKSYRMMPAVAASIVIFIEHLRWLNQKEKKESKGYE